MRSRRRLILTAIVGVLLVVLPILMTLQTPGVDVEAIRLEEDQGDIDTLFEVGVDNPNIVGATVLSIEGKAYVNGEYAGDFMRDEEVYIGPLSSTLFDVEFVLKNVAPVKPFGENDVRVVGTVVLDGAITDWEVDFDETRTVTVL